MIKWEKNGSAVGTVPCLSYLIIGIWNLFRHSNFVIRHSALAPTIEIT